MKNQSHVCINVTCSNCNESTELLLNAVNYQKWTSRKMLIQDAFPDLDKADRELLISKTCGKCWNKLFGPPPRKKAAAPKPAVDLYSIDDSGDLYNGSVKLALVAFADCDSFKDISRLVELANDSIQNASLISHLVKLANDFLILAEFDDSNEVRIEEIKSVLAAAKKLWLKP